MTTALARLIKEAPDIAREVMIGRIHQFPNGDILCAYLPEDVRYMLPLDILPAWFYSAVAGNLAQWLADRSTAVMPDGNSYRIMTYQASVKKALDNYSWWDTKRPTFLDALVEAAIVVGREGK